MKHIYPKVFCFGIHNEMRFSHDQNIFRSKVYTFFASYPTPFHFLYFRLSKHRTVSSRKKNAAIKKKIEKN